MRFFLSLSLSHMEYTWFFLDICWKGIQDGNEMFIDEWKKATRHAYKFA